MPRAMIYGQPTERGFDYPVDLPAGQPVDYTLMRDMTAYEHRVDLTRFEGWRLRIQRPHADDEVDYAPIDPQHDGTDEGLIVTPRAVVLVMPLDVVAEYPVGQENTWQLSFEGFLPERAHLWNEETSRLRFIDRDE